MNRGAAHVLATPIVQPREEATLTQLARHGYRPEDIEYVFITHLHFDHVDQLDLYTNAKIVISARGLAAATANPGWRGSWAPGKTLEGLTNLWKDRVIAVDDVDAVHALYPTATDALRSFHRSGTTFQHRPDYRPLPAKVMRRLVSVYAERFADADGRAPVTYHALTLVAEKQ